MIRVRVEVPADGGDGAVVKALRAVGAALKAPVEFSKTAPENSYGLTLHVYPDPEA